MTKATQYIEDFEASFGENLNMEFIGYETTPNGRIIHLKGISKKQEREVYAYIDENNEVIEESPDECAEAIGFC